MQVTKTELAPCTYKLRIELDADAVESAYRKVWRDFARHTNVPGFRPGKAPQAVLERYVDETRLRDAVIASLARPAYLEALRQQELEPMNEPEIEPGDLVRGESWAFEATVITPPVVTLGDVRGAEVEKPDIPITEEDLSRSLETLRQQHMLDIPVNDRGARAGDVIFGEVRIQMEGEEPQQPATQRLTVGQTIPDLDKGLLGIMVDETRTISVRFPDDYAVQEQAGRNGTVTVTAKSIVERKLPEVTDEWIREIKAGESVEDFLAKERRRLEAHAERIAEDVRRSRAIDVLVERSKVAYAPALLEEEVNGDLSRLALELRANGLTYEQYLESANLTREVHEAQLEAEADRRVRSRYVLREFARREGLELAEETISQALEHSRRLAAAGALAEGQSPESQARSVLNRILYDRIGARVLELMEQPAEAEPACVTEEGDADAAST